MEGYSSNDTSLVAVLQRLTNLINRNNNTLSEHNSYQQNQIASLTALGLVQQVPVQGQAGNATQPSEGKSLNPTVFQAIVKQLDVLEQQTYVLQQQSQGAKFIGDILYNQTEAGFKQHQTDTGPRPASY